MDRTIPKDLVYFENDVVDVRGAERVELVRLRADLCRASAFSTRALATCCHSMVAIDHPAYRQNVVMLATEAARVSTPEPLPQQRQIFVGDWEGSLPAFEAPASSPYATVPFCEPCATPRTGVKIQDSDLWRGKPVRVVGLREGQRDFG